MFDKHLFREKINESLTLRMIAIKLSQGAKLGHGRILPNSKITSEIARAQKLLYPPIDNCCSPPGHSAFVNHCTMIEFISRLRKSSGSLPVLDIQ